MIERVYDQKYSMYSAQHCTSRGGQGEICWHSLERPRREGKIVPLCISDMRLVFTRVRKPARADEWVDDIVHVCICV